MARTNSFDVLPLVALTTVFDCVGGLNLLGCMTATSRSCRQKSLDYLRSGHASHASDLQFALCIERLIASLISIPKPRTQWPKHDASTAITRSMIGQDVSSFTMSDFLSSRSWRGLPFVPSEHAAPPPMIAATASDQGSAPLHRQVNALHGRALIIPRTRAAMAIVMKLVNFYGVSHRRVGVEYKLQETFGGKEHVKQDVVWLEATVMSRLPPFSLRTLLGLPGRPRRLTIPRGFVHRVCRWNDLGAFNSNLGSLGNAMAVRDRVMMPRRFDTTGIPVVVPSQVPADKIAPSSKNTVKQMATLSQVRCRLQENPSALRKEIYQAQYHIISTVKPKVDLPKRSLR